MMTTGSGNLVLKPLSGQLTHDTDTWTKMDPYVKFIVGGQTQKTAVCNGGGKFPSWTETITFRRGTEDLINVEVWDKDPSNDDLVGQGAIAFSTITNAANNFNGWVDLSYKGKGAGKILISAQFFPDASTTKVQLGGFGGMPVSLDFLFSSIFLSLCH